MCGICGFFNSNKSLSEELLLAMNAKIVRRGPDGEGHYHNGKIGLAMRRLAIIDLGGGHQPIFNEDQSVCVVFNGEIYNYKHLRNQLNAKGHRFTTNSDTEVIVHLYEEYGASLSIHLEGMFAFALWDLKTETLVLSRDRIGIKPLYVSHQPEGLLFASEIKSLLTTRLVSDTLDWQALDEYLTYTNIPCPRTIFADIKQIEPATTLVVKSEQNMTSEKYWTLPPPPVETNMATSEAQWIKNCEDGLRSSVEKHLVSDVPVGAFLSGGVDSGLLVALMADILDQPVETFTVGFQKAGSSFLDERKYSQAMAQRYNLNHHDIDVTPQLEEIIWDIVMAFDQPFADDSVIPSYYVSKIAAQHVKVAMTGLGGDELFGGYRRHSGLLFGDRYAHLPSIVKKKLIEPIVARIPVIDKYADTIDHLKRFLRASDLPAQNRYQDSMASLPWNERKCLYKPEVLQKIDVTSTTQVIVKPFLQDVTSTLERALQTDLHTYLMDDILTLTDRLSMWHSLELRVPYLDHQFVEFSRKIPSNLKIKGTTQKYLLKKVAERWLPKDMIYHKKQGFEAPMGSWLRGPLLPFFDSIVSESTIDQMGIFQFEEILRLREEHSSGRKKNNKILFSILMFCLWHRQLPSSMT